MIIEEKALHGQRESNNDGFTYVAGKHKAGRKKRTRNKTKTARCIRSDKRSVKQKSINRMLSEF